MNVDGICVVCVLYCVCAAQNDDVDDGFYGSSDSLFLGRRPMLFSFISKAPRYYVCAAAPLCVYILCSTCPPHPPQKRKKKEIWKLVNN